MVFAVKNTMKTFSLFRAAKTIQHSRLIIRVNMATNTGKQLTIDTRLTLSDKYTMPQFGLGTWRSEPGQVQNIVKEAILNNGYRLIDGAWIYGNENEVGNGIHEALDASRGKIKREDLFITTKLWNQYHAPDDVDWAMRDSLKKLRLDYVDLYLMHWPVAFKKMSENNWSQSEDKKQRFYAEGVTLEDTWKAMEKLVDQKLTRSIGVSNFNESQIEEILKIARIKPVNNQIELHPYLNQRQMRAFCSKHHITITSYCPLANLKRENESEDAAALNNPVIQSIAKAKNKSTAQVIIRWHLQHGLIVIPKTVTPSRLAENAQVFDFELSDDEIRQIDAIGDKKSVRFVNPPFLPPGDKKVFDA